MLRARLAAGEADPMRVRRSSSPSTPKIGLPLVEPIQRIMIRAEAFWQAVPANRSVEHAAQRHTINDAAVNAKTDDATG